MADPQPKPSDVRAAVHDELCGWPDENDVDRVLDTYADHLSAAGFRLVPPGWRIVKVEHLAVGNPLRAVPGVAVRISEEWDG